MTGDEQFWWDWWVSLAVAISTFAAVLVALFGQSFQSKFFPPLLKLKLKEPLGVKTRIVLYHGNEDGSVGERTEDARYWHLRVWNNRRWSPATNTQVFLVRVEEPGPDGDFRMTWAGEVPMRWRFQETSPIFRTIGSAADCDLCTIVRDKWLELLPLITPNNLNAKRREPAIVIVTFQVRANEADSELFRLKLSWDGGWHDGAQEMQGHFVAESLGNIQ